MSALLVAAGCSALMDYLDLMHHAPLDQQGWASPMANAEELALAAAQVASHARRASVLSEMLLDLARMETGVFALSRSEVNLADLASQVIADVQITAPDHLFQLGLTQLTAPAVR